MKRWFVMLLLAVAGVVAACGPGGSSPGVSTETLPPVGSAEPVTSPSSELPSDMVSLEPSPSAVP